MNAFCKPKEKGYKRKNNNARRGRGAGAAEQQCWMPEPKKHIDAPSDPPYLVLSQAPKEQCCTISNRTTIQTSMKVEQTCCKLWQTARIKRVSGAPPHPARLQQLTYAILETYHLGKRPTLPILRSIVPAICASGLTQDRSTSRKSGLSLPYPVTECKREEKKRKTGNL